MCKECKRLEKALAETERMWREERRLRKIAEDVAIADDQSKIPK